MKKIGPLFFPDHETKFAKHGERVWKIGRKDREAAYQYVKRWRRALDVGANVGVFSRPFAKKFDEVVAFEPMPLTRECLVSNVPANVRIESCAVSDREGILQMYRMSTSGGSFVCNHPLVTRPMETGKPDRIIEVETRPLDSFEFDAVDLIKLDIQGAEYAALLGAKETITRHRPVVMVEEKAASVEKVGIEVHQAWLETIAKTAELLRSYGMTPKEKARTDRIYVFEE